MFEIECLTKFYFNLEYSTEKTRDNISNIILRDVQKGTVDWTSSDVLVNRSFRISLSRYNLQDQTSKTFKIRLSRSDFQDKTSKIRLSRSDFQDKTFKIRLSG